MRGFADEFLTNYLALHKKTVVTTVRALGNDEAFTCSELTRDVLAVTHEIIARYRPRTLVRSILFAQPTPLLNSLHGMQHDFLLGRYAEVGRSLRFAWELVFRTFHTDTYKKRKRGKKDGPGPTLDEKAAWMEKQKLNWPTAVLPTLRHLFRNWKQTEIEAQFKPVWDRFNEVVHPSASWMYSGVRKSARMTFNHFDKQSATQLLADGAEVCAVIFAACAKLYPRIIRPLAANPNLFLKCPRFRLLLPRVGDGE
jgi:hypothetical protein